MEICKSEGEKLNLAATILEELAKWKNVEVQEPVFSSSFTKDKFLLLNSSVKIHTQSTECAVKQVTETAKSVDGPDA